jgi:plasmid stabilization system protein ParE
MTGELHPEAKLELLDGAAWYAERSVLASARFVAAVEGAISAILADPERYQPAGDAVRVFRLRNFPYKVYFHYDEKEQQIRFLCVMHNKRRPDYWRDRK